MLKTLLMSSALLLSATTLACNKAAASVVAIPDPAVDETLRTTPAKQTIVLAGGCFWGVDAVFKHVKGVTDVKSGFAGGKGPVSYEEVSTGNTGYAESVQITYDPSKITYGKLLKVFFAVAHDPTEVNRQGPDSGTQYRSAIFFSTDEQKRIAQAYIEQLNKARVFSAKLATELSALDTFREAEAYHQNYLANHKDEPYIVYNDLPKLENLRKEFPELYRESEK
ncbi:MAG TPA: peptide-methionine (S)-S-oxide reductase MsrA [Pyrinomonadaceae bacterium]|nr:peptide-methionine (S)-S-oxide reductase MsrA [Pyrinomonadaceae bacterium]